MLKIKLDKKGQDLLEGKLVKCSYAREHFDNLYDCKYKGGCAEKVPFGTKAYFCGDLLYRLKGK